MKCFFKVLFFSLLFHINTSNASETSISLSQEQVRQSIVETLQVLNDVYVFPEKSKKVQNVITERMHKGAYDHIKTNIEFQKHNCIYIYLRFLPEQEIAQHLHL